MYFVTPGPEWHLYGNIPGPSGLPTTLCATLEGTPVSVFYPRPVIKPDPLDPSLTVGLYAARTPFFIPAAPAVHQKMEVSLEGLLCSNKACQPLRTNDSLVFTEADLANAPFAEEQDWWALFTAALEGVEAEDNASASEVLLPAKAGLEVTPRYFAPGLEVRTLSKAAALALLAGLVLNFMPCVLPVITLKLRSFIPVASSVPLEQRQTFRAHNLFFALGIVLYFLVLASIIAVTGMAWGQIFQQPSAIITLAAVVFALSLSLFGVYDLPLIDLKGKPKGATHYPRLESFSAGILATILATPCSGPFLGGVLAWALLQPPQVIALVLGCIGLGMAAPYLLMAGYPGLYRFLPRPGGWTVALERFLGFLLIGTTVYLIGLLPAALYLDVLVLLWILALGCWIWGQWTSLTHSLRRRLFVRGGAIVLVALTAFYLFRPVQYLDLWRPFDQNYFAAHLGRKTMLVEFTADWCPNCKFLEKTVLSPKRSADLVADFDVELLRVDLTRHDPELMAFLESLGSKSIPVLAIFPHNNPQSPLVLRDLFTSEQLQEALKQEHKTVR